MCVKNVPECENEEENPHCSSDFGQGWYFQVTIFFPYTVKPGSS